MDQSSVGEFAAEFDAVVRERAAAELFEPILMTDGELAGHDFTLDLARELRFAGPWGQGFAEPVFDNAFVLDSWRLVGSKHWKLRLRLSGQVGVIDAMLFNAEPGATPPEAFRAAYQLDINEWNGRESLQLILRHVELP